jgi:hypothetical protein
MYAGDLLYCFGQKVYKNPEYYTKGFRAQYNFELKGGIGGLHLTIKQNDRPSSTGDSSVVIVCECCPEQFNYENGVTDCAGGLFIDEP